MKKKDGWRPVRRGIIYCSPLCGGDCTYAAYVKAVKDSTHVASVMNTKGWMPRVWENIGWHWCLANKLCGMSLHVDKRYGGPRYWCMMADQPVTMISYGSPGIGRTRYFTNPNHAVAACYESAVAFFRRQNKAWQHLERIV